MESSSPFGGEIPHGMVAGHCLAPFGLWSFGLESPCVHAARLWATVLLLLALFAGESFGQESLLSSATMVPITFTSSLSRHAAL